MNSEFLIIVLLVSSVGIAMMIQIIKKIRNISRHDPNNDDSCSESCPSCPLAKQYKNHHASN